MIPSAFFSSPFHSSNGDSISQVVRMAQLNQNFDVLAGSVSLPHLFWLCFNRYLVYIPGFISILYHAPIRFEEMLIRSPIVRRIYSPIAHKYDEWAPHSNNEAFHGLFFSM